MMDDNGTVVKRTHFDYPLIIVTAILVMIGVVMVYSSSAVLAMERTGDGYFYLKKEIVFALVGFIMLFVAAKVPYHWLKKMVYPILGFAMLMLVLSFIPGLKSSAGGASRWVRLGPVTFQPSEFAKFALVIFLALNAILLYLNTPPSFMKYLMLCS